MGKAFETVNRFYDTTENKKGKGLDTILANDMTFVGPLKTCYGAQDYIESTK